jgi:hypothetical protein
MSPHHGPETGFEYEVLTTLTIPQHYGRVDFVEWLADLNFISEALIITLQEMFRWNVPLKIGYFQ